MPQGVLFLVVATIALFIFCLLTGIGLIAVAYHFRSKAYIARRRYNLIERGLDRDPKAGLKEINEALRYIEGDLRWGRYEPRNVTGHQPPLLVDDNGFPSSDGVLSSEPARTKRSS